MGKIGSACTTTSGSTFPGESTIIQTRDQSPNIGCRKPSGARPPPPSTLTFTSPTASPPEEHPLQTPQIQLTKGMGDEGYLRWYLKTLLMKLQH